MMSNDVAALFAEKADLERKTTELIAEFEEFDEAVKALEDLKSNLRNQKCL